MGVLSIYICIYIYIKNIYIYIFIYIFIYILYNFIAQFHVHSIDLPLIESTI